MSQNGFFYTSTWITLDPSPSRANDITSDRIERYNNNSSLGKDKNDIYMTFGNDSIINSTKQEKKK